MFELWLLSLLSVLLLVSLLQTYLKLLKKQQKELNALKKKHSKVGEAHSCPLAAHLVMQSERDSHNAPHTHTHTHNIRAVS